MKIKIAVLFGGKSVEHEISVISAIQAIQSMNKDKYDVIPVYMTKDNRMYVGDAIGDIESYRKDIGLLLEKSQQVVFMCDGSRTNLLKYPLRPFKNNLYASIDVAFPIVHGTNVEDGALQGFLQTLNLPYVGCDVLSSAVGMDKYAMKAVLKDKNIPVLECLCFDSAQYRDDASAIMRRIEKEIGFPVMIKPVNLGSSIGINKAKTHKELEDALELAFAFAGRVLAERAIEDLQEINCSVIGDYESAQASECEEPVSSGELLSYSDKYLNGGKGGSSSKGGKTAAGALTGGKGGMSSLQRRLPADIPPALREQVRTLAVQTFQALGCNGVSRIDFMVDRKTGALYVNEINTIPGSLAFYLWEPLGISYTQLLDKMISLALKRKRENESIHYSFDTNVLAGVSLSGGKSGKL